MGLMSTDASQFGLTAGFDGKTHVTGSAWDHGDHNGRHERFSLSCEEYRELVDRAAGHCEICGEPEPELVIDHDHRHEKGLRAVRGLLCTGCNVRLGDVDRENRPATPEERHYLDNPFHLGIPHTRPRKPRGRGPSRPAVPGRHGAETCPKCRRLINLDESGHLRGHNHRVGRDADLYGSTGCIIWPLGE